MKHLLLAALLSAAEEVSRTELTGTIEETELLVDMVEGLTVPERVPYDFRATAKEMQEKLAAVETYDTSNLRSLAGEFFRLAVRLARSETFDNGALIRISRALNSVYYSRSGPFDQDSNELIPRFPGLAASSELASLDPEGDEARFLRVRLKREENRIEEALREAIDVAAALVRSE